MKKMLILVIVSSFVLSVFGLIRKEADKIAQKRIELLETQGGEQAIKVFAMYKERQVPVNKGIFLTLKFHAKKNFKIINPLDTLQIFINDTLGERYIFRSSRRFSNPPGNLIGKYPAISYIVIKAEEIGTSRRELTIKELNSEYLNLIGGKTYNFYLNLDSIPRNTQKIKPEKKVMFKPGEYSTIISLGLFVRNNPTYSIRKQSGSFRITLANSYKGKVPTFSAIGKKHEYLERKVTIIKTKITMDEFLIDLQKQTKVLILPSGELPTKTMIRNIRITNKSLRYVLDEYFNQKEFKWLCTHRGVVLIEKRK